MVTDRKKTDSGDPTRGYTLSHLPGHVMVCDRCGCLVLHTKDHTLFHQDLDRAIQAARGSSA